MKITFFAHLAKIGLDVKKYIFDAVLYLSYTSVFELIVFFNFVFVLFPSCVSLPQISDDRTKKRLINVVKSQAHQIANETSTGCHPQPSLLLPHHDKTTHSFRWAEHNFCSLFSRCGARVATFIIHSRYLWRQPL